MANRDLLEELNRRYGSIPDVILERDDAVDAVAPYVRSDYRAMAGYRYHDERPLDIRAHACVSVDDGVNALHMEGWRTHFSRGLDVHEFRGGHFYLKDDDALARLASIVVDVLDEDTTNW